MQVNAVDFVVFLVIYVAQSTDTICNYLDFEQISTNFVWRNVD